MGKHATKEELDRAFEEGEREGKAGSMGNQYGGFSERTTELNKAHRDGFKKGSKDD
jgi:hypothetical protein